MKSIKVYNYNKEFDKSLIEFIISSLESVCRYYISRSWENGPHLIITIEDEGLKYFNGIKEQLEEQLNQLSVDEAYIENLNQQYLNNQSIISKLENKTCDERVLKSHGTIEIVENKFTYHNEGLTKILHECRYLLQPILNELYFMFENQGIDKTAIMPILFYKVSECYKEYEKNKGFFSYISHVQGFFELSKKQSMVYSEEMFEDIYRENFKEMDLYLDSQGDFIDKWSLTWNNVMHKLEREVPGYIDDSYKKTLYETFGALDKDYDNNFHKNFVRFAKKTNFIENIEATAYRFLINILYLSLPFLKISALKKQKYCYMAYRYTEHIYKINWREVVSGEI